MAGSVGMGLRIGRSEAVLKHAPAGTFKLTGSDAARRWRRWSYG
jgi:hypothetical protein